MFIIPDLFTPYINGREMAIQRNWQDLSNYNNTQAGQLNNAFNFMTLAPRTNAVYENLTGQIYNNRNAARNDILYELSMLGRLAQTGALSAGRMLLSPQYGAVAAAAEIPGWYQAQQTQQTNASVPNLAGSSKGTTVTGGATQTTPPPFMPNIPEFPNIGADVQNAMNASPLQEHMFKALETQGFRRGTSSGFQNSELGNILERNAQLLQVQAPINDLNTVYQDPTLAVQLGQLSNEGAGYVPGTGISLWQNPFAGNSDAFLYQRLIDDGFDQNVLQNLKPGSILRGPGYLVYMGENGRLYTAPAASGGNFLYTTPVGPPQ